MIANDVESRVRHRGPQAKVFVCGLFFAYVGWHNSCFGEMAVSHDVTTHARIEERLLGKQSPIFVVTKGEHRNEFDQKA